MKNQRIGKILKLLRIHRGITGPEIQKKLGISTNSLYDYEKGRSFPKAEYAKRLFTLLQVDEDVFWEHIHSAENDVPDHVICNNILKNCDLKKEIRRKQHIGQVLRAIRHIRILSVQSIVESCGVHEQCFYGYEQGKCFPKFHNAKKLFTTLKVDPEIFLKYSSDLEAAPEELAKLIIRDSEESSMPVSQEETIPCDQDPFDNMILEAVRHGLKNLTPEEKTIFFRNTVNFTTNKIKEAFYRK